MKWDGSDYQLPFSWGDTYYDLYLAGGFGFNTGNGDLLGIPFPASQWAGQWVHVAAKFYNGTPSADNVQLYIDGQRQELTERMQSPDDRSVATTAFAGGLANTNYCEFGGAIDDLRIFNRPLSAAEVGVLAGSAPTCWPRPARPTR